MPYNFYDKERKKYFLIAAIISIIASTAYLFIFSGIFEKDVENYRTIEDPLEFNSDLSLASYFSNTTYDGESWETAYIFEDISFDIGYDDFGLKFSNIHKYVILRNCEFISEYSNAEGLIISDSSNIRIQNNDLLGVQVIRSVNCSFNNNILTYQGLIIESSSSLDIDDTNTIDGFSIKYFENQANLDIDYTNLRLGQIILNNCTSMNISNTRLNHIYQGISIFDSHFIILNNININGSYTAIQLEYSNNITISYTEISNCVYGIYINYGGNFSLSDNNFESNIWGVYSDNGAKTLVVHNYFKTSKDFDREDYNYQHSYSFGVNIYQGGNHSINENTFELMQGSLGIKIQYSHNNSYFANDFYGGIPISFDMNDDDSLQYNTFNSNQFNNGYINTDIVFSPNFTDSNVLDGKKIYAYKNLEDFTITSLTNISLLIVESCTNFTISNISFSHYIHEPLRVEDCSDAVLNNISITYSYGLHIRSSNNISVQNSNFDFTKTSIYSLFNENVYYIDNTISNSDIGIEFHFEKNVTIQSNTISSSFGIISKWCSGLITIEDNYLDHVDEGINISAGVIPSYIIVGNYISYYNYSIIIRRDYNYDSDPEYVIINDPSLQEDNTCVNLNKNNSIPSYNDHIDNFPINIILIGLFNVISIGVIMILAKKNKSFGDLRGSNLLKTEKTNNEGESDGK